MSNPSESQDLVTTIDGAVAWLRLDRPRQQNALSFALVEAMDAEVIRLTMDEAVRVLVITGTGSAFCAGVDLKDSGFEEVFRDGADRMKLPLRAHAMMARLRSCPKPIIAALNGTTVAGGLELALACDIRLATASARIGDGHLRVGVIPGAGGAAVTPRLIGPGLAKLLLFTGDLWTAERAVAAGLVEAVAADTEFSGFVTQVARRIAGHSPLALAVTKRLVADCASMTVEAGIAEELNAVRAYSRSEDFAEGIRAFKEKRAPIFVGR